MGMLNVRAGETASEFNRFAQRMGMPSRCDASLSFETPKLGDAAAVWLEKAGNNEPPPRSDLSARTLKAFLPNVIIADRIEDDDKCRYRFRVMGTMIAELFGDHTGKFLDEAVISPFSERWFAIFDAANNAGCPLRIFGRLDYRRQNHLGMELMVAPLGTRIGHAEAVLVIAYASYSARHVFQPLVKNTITLQEAVAS